MTLCCICRKPVYPADKHLQYQDKIYHGRCFTCTSCHKKLDLRNVRSFDKVPYCENHSPQTNRKEIVDLTGLDTNITEKQQDEDSEDAHTTPVSVPQESQIEKRIGVLATGYSTYQLQIELAGQMFTIDPVKRQNMFDMFREFNVIVCGSARVGKSTLINAMCGRPLARTHPGLDSCTKEISRYVLNEKCFVDNEWITYTYNFWDTPGFESWNEKDIRENFSKIMHKPKSDPLCMIYCASPGSFADTQQLQWLLDVCIQDHKLLCALVVTNKWAGQKSQRMAVLNRYKEILGRYHKQTGDVDDITYFGNVGLCAMVNTQPYTDEDQDIHRDEEGVDELIEAIMSCLDDDGRVFHWCMAVMQKKGLFGEFKGKMKQRFGNFKDFLIKKFGNKNS